MLQMIPNKTVRLYNYIKNNGKMPVRFSWTFRHNNFYNQSPFTHFELSNLN